MSKRTAAFLAKAKKGSSYWIEKCKLDFAVKLHKHMKVRNINNTELANRIDSSSPYITKVLRGDTNLTIESMAKLAHAVGAELAIDIKYPGVANFDQWKAYVRPQVAGAPMEPIPAVRASNTTTTIYSASNHDAFANKQELVA